MPRRLTIVFPDDEQQDPEFNILSMDAGEVPKLVKRAYDFLKSKEWIQEDPVDISGLPTKPHDKV